MSQISQADIELCEKVIRHFKGMIAAWEEWLKNKKEEKKKINNQ